MDYGLNLHAIPNQLTQKMGHKIQMIILRKHNNWAVHISNCRGNRCRKLLVDRHIALLPSIPNFGGNAWLAGCIPQLMLDKPQQRIADDVVVLFILRLAHGRNQLQPYALHILGRAALLQGPLLIAAA
jgi:hypothetical protein